MAGPIAPPQSVLVYVGLDRVGDALLKLPFVRGLRQAFPGARVTWVAGKETSVYAGAMAPLVAGLLDEVIEYAGIGLAASEMFRPRPLNGRGFDLIIDTQRILWPSCVLWRIPHKAFISPAGRFLLSSIKPKKGYRPPKSMQRQMLDLLELASGQRFPTPAKLHLDLDPAFDAEAERLLPPGPDYVAFAPGSGGLPKCWPLPRFIAMAKRQTARGRRPVFILGPQEPHWRAEIEAALPAALFPLQQAGIAERFGFSPLFTIALSKRFRGALSNDSGVGHMLAIGGRPLVSLFGPTVPEKFMPMSDCVTILRAASFGGREMERIPNDAVDQALEAALAGGGCSSGG